jgi:hypothetical protein
MLCRAAVLALPAILTLPAVLAGAGCRDVHAAADAAGGGGDDDSALDAAPALPDAMIDPIDGAPVRMPCTSTFAGTALADNEYGRLDGILVAIVPPGSSVHGCNSDETHVHLQVKVSGAVYDVAVNVGSDVHTTSIDRALFAPAWAEGWHPAGGADDIYVDYPGLGLHSDTIPLSTKDDLVSTISADLAVVNHISVYAIGYGPDGAHLVHYNSLGHDGMIVTQPLSPTSHMRAFSFDSDSF